jgi:hypothetical protein
VGEARPGVGKGARQLPWPRALRDSQDADAPVQANKDINRLSVWMIEAAKAFFSEGHNVEIIKDVAKQLTVERMTRRVIAADTPLKHKIVVFTLRALHDAPRCRQGLVPRSLAPRSPIWWNFILVVEMDREGIW